MPLGDTWRGACKAEADSFVPENSVLSELCNMGYARGRCPRYPQADARDAIRFLIARDRDQLIRIEYVVEHDHLPYGYGALQYHRASGALVSTLGDAVIERQALAYVTSYLRRKPAVG